MHPLSRALRRDLAGLAGIAENDLRLLFREFDTAEAARDGLMDVLPRMVALYGAAAASLASDYYDEIRDASEARGRFRAITAEPKTGTNLDVLARWAVGPLFQAEPDPESALTLVSGGAQRAIADAARDTVTFSSYQDTRARGWARVGAGGCDFCRDLIGRGAVYTEATADFESHNHCRCGAEPVFD